MLTPNIDYSLKPLPFEPSLHVVSFVPARCEGLHAPTFLASAQWYGRSYPEGWSRDNDRHGCYFVGAELTCRNPKGEWTVRTNDVLAASLFGVHLFALKEVPPGAYAPKDAAYYGPSFP